MAVLRWIAVLLVAGCFPDVDYAGTDYRCSDGVTCPSGYECVAQVCVRPGGADVDASLADARVGPDVEPLPIDPPMIDIPASSFVQGCIFFGDESCPFDAMPNESISLSAYRIDRHEVTQADYEVCVQAGACTPPGGDYDPAGAPLLPVASVTHGQASNFCAWLNRRLPTESEWERAARGTDQRTYPWGEADPSCALAQKAGCEGDRLPVESLAEAVTPVGAFDMAGNVSEWVADWYNPAYYPTGENVDPQGPASGQDRVVRGGSHDSDDEDLTTWRRDRARPDQAQADRGFRCAD